MDIYTTRDIVDELNENFYDITLNSKLVPFSHESDSEKSVIKFLNYILWSESHYPPFDNTKEKIKEFVLREANYLLIDLIPYKKYLTTMVRV